jgi:hypothetical protein
MAKKPTHWDSAKNFDFKKKSFKASAKPTEPDDVKIKDAVKAVGEMIEGSSVIQAMNAFLGNALAIGGILDKKFILNGGAENTIEEDAASCGCPMCTAFGAAKKKVILGVKLSPQEADIIASFEKLATPVSVSLMVDGFDTVVDTEQKFGTITGKMHSKEPTYAQIPKSSKLAGSAFGQFLGGLKYAKNGFVDADAQGIISSKPDTMAPEAAAAAMTGQALVWTGDHWKAAGEAPKPMGNVVPVLKDDKGNTWEGIPMKEAEWPSEVENAKKVKQQLAHMHAEKLADQLAKDFVNMGAFDPKSIHNWHPNAGLEEEALAILATDLVGAGESEYGSFDTLGMSKFISGNLKSVLKQAKFGALYGAGPDTMGKLLANAEFDEDSEELQTMAQFEKYLGSIIAVLPPSIVVDHAYDYKTKMMKVKLFDCLTNKTTLVEFDYYSGYQTKGAVKDTIYKAVSTLAGSPEGAISKEQANEGNDVGLALKSFNGLSTIKKIGVPQPLFDWISKDGSVDYKDGCVVVKAGTHSVSVPMALAHIQGANLGTIPQFVKTKYQIEFKSALNALHKQWLAGAMIKAEKDDTDSIYAELTNPLDKLPTIKKPDASKVEVVTKPKANPFKKFDDSDKGASSVFVPFDTPLAEAIPGGASIKHKPAFSAPIFKKTKTVEIAEPDAWQLYNLEDLLSVPLRPLSTAEALYEPVQGSTPGKRYYCMAIGEEFRVGAAWVGNELSIRIEAADGHDWEAEAHKVSDVFDKKPMKQYGSMHVEVSNDLIAAKVMGAALSGVGVAWKTPLPNVLVIKGKTIL